MKHIRKPGIFKRFSDWRGRRIRRQIAIQLAREKYSPWRRKYRRWAHAHPWQYGTMIGGVISPILTLNVAPLVRNKYLIPAVAAAGLGSGILGGYAASKLSKYKWQKYAPKAARRNI